jgi:hypothetical protein
MAATLKRLRPSPSWTLRRRPSFCLCVVAACGSLPTRARSRRILWARKNAGYGGRLSELAAVVGSHSKNKLYRPVHTRTVRVQYGPCLTSLPRLLKAASWICIRLGPAWLVAVFTHALDRRTKA